MAAGSSSPWATACSSSSRASWPPSAAPPPFDGPWGNVRQRCPRIVASAIGSGVTFGDIVIYGDDILGGVVNVAARLEALAETSRICVPRKVADEERNRLDLGYASGSDLAHTAYRYRCRGIVTAITGPTGESGLREVYPSSSRIEPDCRTLQRRPAPLSRYQPTMDLHKKIPPSLPAVPNQLC